MTLNRNKPPLNLRSRRHAEKYKSSWEKSAVRFKNDLKSQQAAVELQIPKACRKIQNHAEKYIIYSQKTDIHFQNDLKSQQATVEFQIPKACRKIHNFLRKIRCQFQNDFKSQQAAVELQIPKACLKIYIFFAKKLMSISRMILNRNKPPSKFRSRRHVEKYRISAEKNTCPFPEWL